MILVSHAPGWWSRIAWPSIAPRSRQAAQAAEPTHQFTMQLRLGASEVVARPNRGVSVRCKRGRLWITHDGDPKDVVLDAGQAYTPERGGRMTLHAVQESDIDLAFRRVP